MRTHGAGCSAYFYPRSPRGERPPTKWTRCLPVQFLSTLPARGATNIGLYVVDSVEFLSTLPARGATFPPARPAPVLDISIHAPREGSDPKLKKPRGSWPPYFYPRSPRGERPGRVEPVDQLVPISIHAPREGSDRSAAGCWCPPGHFYPRSPRGSDFRAVSGHVPHDDISIHAPREGSDQALEDLDVVMLFLSTLPARGATETHRPDF